MESIFYIKKVGQKDTIQSKNGNLSKVTIVLNTKECRMGDSGTYAIDQDFVFDLIGDRADNFSLKEGEWLIGSLSFTAREHQGSSFQDIRLNRYCKL